MPNGPNELTEEQKRMATAFAEEFFKQSPARAAKRVFKLAQWDLCLDFDGVVHGYASGWQGATTIPDEPVEGAFDAIREYLDAGITVNLYSSRSKEDGAIEAMKAWFGRHGAGDIAERLKFPTQKPAANMTIDDRAFCFEGDFPSMRWLLDFKPWNKR